MMTESFAPLYCTNHPAEETSLRCNRCEKPICAKCAVQTPTGYRCKSCVRGQQKIFESAEWYDYLIAFAGAGLASFIASLIVSFISSFFFGLFVLILAPAAGVAIAEIVRFITRRRRSIGLFRTALAGMIAGALPMLVFTAIPALALLMGIGFEGIFGLLPLVWQIVYISTASPAMYYRLSGIRFRR